MSFVGKNLIFSRLKQKNKYKKALQMHSHIKQHQTCIVKQIKQFIEQRMSSFFFAKISAAVSVEASLVVPIFLFFIINLIFIIQMFTNYSESLAKSCQEAKYLAVLSNDINDNSSELISIEDEIMLNPLINVYNFNSARVLTGVKYRKWTGYSVTNGQDSINDEEYVYIAESGYVYHRSLECRHLKIQIMVVNSSTVDNYRNKVGAKYKPCELCGVYKTGILFITPEGDRFHCNAKCSGLKRNIRIINIKNVGSRGPCSVCG